MRVIEDLKGKVDHVIINKLTGINTGYHLEEEANNEFKIDKLIWGNDNVELILVNDIGTVNELDYQGGDVRVNNTKMIETNGRG